MFMLSKLHVDELYNKFQNCDLFLPIYFIHAQQETQNLYELLYRMPNVI